MTFHLKIIVSAPDGLLPLPDCFFGFDHNNIYVYT